MKLLALLVGKLVVKLHYRKYLDIYALCSVHEPELHARGQRKARIPSSIRWKVWRRDNFTCHYCGEWGNHLSLDHVIPEQYGGGFEADNLVTACSSCNRKKSSTSYEEFLSSSWLIKKRSQNSSTTQKRPRTKT